MFIKIKTAIGDHYINPTYISAVLPAADANGRSVLGVCGVFVVGTPQPIQLNMPPESFIDHVIRTIGGMQYVPPDHTADKPPHGDGSQNGALRISP